MTAPIIIIPARYASTRFPGKPLVRLRGPDGHAKSLVERSWEAAQAVREVEAVYVATDDDRIADHVAGFGGKVIMTPEDCCNGTERCSAALRSLPTDPEIVVNLQGDAPLTPAWFVEELIAALRVRPDVDLATPVLRCDHAHWRALCDDRRAGRVGGTTAVFGDGGRALYFSKEVIPYIDPAQAALIDPLPIFHHVGVYAYRPDTLRAYANWPMGELERQEGLEQLRFLEQGKTVLCVESDAKGRAFWELNNPEDVDRIESALNHA